MIYDIIKGLCDEQNIPVTKLEEELGLGRGTIGKWKTSKPRVDKLKIVTDYFGLSIDKLMEEVK